jgi:hypothetical protein
MLYRGVEGVSGGLRCFELLRGGFSHVSSVSSIFLVAASDGGKVIVYAVLCSV